MNTPEETPVRIYSPTTPKKKRSVRRTTLSKKKKQRGKREESPDEKQELVERVCTEDEEELEWLQDINCRQLLQELKQNQKLLTMGMDGGDSEGSSSGSDQNPSEDNLEPELIAKLLPSNMRHKYKSGGRRTNQRRKETIRAASQNQVSKKESMRHSLIGKDSQLKKKRAESTKRLASDTERPLSKMRVASRLYYQASEVPGMVPARVKRTTQSMLNRQLRRSLLASIDRRKFMIDFGTSDQEQSQLSVVGRSAQRITLLEPSYNSLSSNIQTPSYFTANGEKRRGPPPVRPFYPRGGSSCQKNDTFRASSKQNRTEAPRSSISFFSSRTHLPVRSYCPQQAQTKHRHSNTDISSARQECKSEEKICNLFGKINPEYLAPFHPLTENRRSSVTALTKNEMALPHIKDAIELNQEIKEIAAKNSKILERNAKASAHCLMQYKLSQVGYAYNSILSRQSPSPVTLIQEKKASNYQSDLEMIQEQSGCKHIRTNSVANKQREEDAAHIRRMNSLRFKQPSEHKPVTSPRSNLAPRVEFLKAPRKPQKHRKATMSKDL